ncbi:MAG: glutaredoxin family protein [Candidatus Dormibacteria bacterium]
MTTITVLSKVDCHFCEEAQATLARLAPELGLEVEVVDLDTPQGQQLAIGAGILFPPGILINGVPFSYGRLSERRLRRALRQQRAVEVKR